MCLQAHYRSELEFTWDNVLAALTRLKRMALAMEKLREKAGFAHDVEGGMDLPALPEHPHPRIAQALADFDAAISDDLNSCKALTIIDDLLAQKKVDAQQRIAIIAKMVDTHFSFSPARNTSRIADGSFISAHAISASAICAFASSGVMNQTGSMPSGNCPSNKGRTMPEMTAL
jgi:cysteinyl-tRNA synthetase